MKSELDSAFSHNLPDVDLDEFDGMEVPKYVEEMELPSNPIKKVKNKQLASFVEDIWLPQPELVDKSLAELEQEDLIYRHQLLKHNDSDKNKAQQILLQRQIYRKVLELGVKINQLSGFASLKEYRKSLRMILKELLKIDKVFMKMDKRPKIKEFSQFFDICWQQMADHAREWSSRVDLKIGADIVDQVIREAEKKTDSDIQLLLMRELKTDNTVHAHKSVKKGKHQFSKHRKLKFDVHEKLQNFMTPENISWDTKKENLVNSLFGKKVESSEKVYLDIPLV